MIHIVIVLVDRCTGIYDTHVENAEERRGESERKKQPKLQVYTLAIHMNTMTRENIRIQNQKRKNELESGSMQSETENRTGGLQRNCINTARHHTATAATPEASRINATIIEYRSLQHKPRRLTTSHPLPQLRHLARTQLLQLFARLWVGFLTMSY